MHWMFQFLIAAGMIGVSVGMILLEHARNRAGQPLLKSEAIAIPYWLIYLSLLALGPALMISAIIR
jgi:uncharacterized protein involved in response to NO